MIVKNLEKIKEKISNLENENEFLFKEIDRNQDLYIEGYIDSLSINNGLTKQIESNEKKISKLKEKLFKNQVTIVEEEKDYLEMEK